MPSLSLFLLVLILPAVCLLIRAQSARAQEQSTMLKGSAVEYAENVQPIDPLLWPGNSFDKNAARSMLKHQDKSGQIWGQVPEWRAGEWHSLQAVNTRAIKYTNGIAHEVTPIGVHTSAGSFNYGLLRDKEGNIWHLYQSDYWTETDLGDMRIVSYVRYSSPGSTGAYKDFYAESIDFKVSKGTNQIGSVRKARTWTRYSPLGPGKLKEESVRTNYNEKGQPTATSYNTSLNTMGKSFNEYEASFRAKAAIVQSLNNYLKEHGLEHLELPLAQVHAPAPAAGSAGPGR